MNRLQLLCAALGLAACGAACADALSVLNDATLFDKAQKDVATVSRAELDVLSDALAVCSAVSIGQRMQQFECERSLNLYYMRYNRGRAIDQYLEAAGGLYAAFDNNALNPSPEMTGGYRRMANNLVVLMKAVNERFRQLEK
jgi:hypothetical protein